MNITRTGERVCQVAATTAIAALLITVIISPRDRSQLKGRIESLKVVDELRPGDVLPMIEVPVISPIVGHVTISQPGTEALIMFYSARCPICKESWPLWNTIAGSVRNLRNIQAIALSVLDEESTRKDLIGHQSDTIVGLFPYTASSRAYKVHQLPAIVFVRNCAVVEAWYGAMSEEQWQGIVRRIAALDTISESKR